jgi:hypothetical protein
MKINGKGDYCPKLRDVIYRRPQSAVDKLNLVNQFFDEEMI